MNGGSTLANATRKVDFSPDWAYVVYRPGLGGGLRAQGIVPGNPQKGKDRGPRFCSILEVVGLA